MMIVLGCLAFFSYFVESIFGFGGTVVFVGLGGFQFEFKDLIYISMLVSSTASACILLQTGNQLHVGKLKSIVLTALPGVIIGTFLVDVLANVWLLKTFAVVLVVYGLHGLVFPAFTPKKALRHFFVGAGGLIQGVFTTGGPFILMGCRHEFDNKTQLKATMAGFFLTLNLIRIVQTLLTHEDAPRILSSHIWLALPVAAGVFLGHRIHVKIPEKIFKQGLLIGITLIGFILVVK